jgi:hypothetical protein
MSEIYSLSSFCHFNIDISVSVSSHLLFHSPFFMPTKGFEFIVKHLKRVSSLRVISIHIA